MLERFLYAQEGSVWGSNESGLTYQEALQEVKNGCKHGHWIWYIFPQMQGLGKSERAQYYGIKGRKEAIEYLNHPVLGKRLKEICEELYHHNIYEVFQGIDIVKVHSCIFLFASISNENSIFNKIKRQNCW